MDERQLALANIWLIAMLSLIAKAKLLLTTRLAGLPVSYKPTRESFAYEIVDGSEL